MDLTAKYHLQTESFCCDPRRRSTFYHHHTKIQEGAWSHFKGLGESYFSPVLNFHILFSAKNAAHLPLEPQQIQRNDVTDKEAWAAEAKDQSR